VRHDAVVRRLHVPSVSALVLVLAGLGVVLLIVAEFTPLLEVKTIQGNSLPDGVVNTGPHHSWALVPLALLAAVLAYGGARGGSRPALIALGVVGIIVALIAVLGDLPDTSKQDLVGSPARGLYEGRAAPRIGMYLETLGAALLVVAAGTGLVLGTGDEVKEPRRRPRPEAADVPPGEPAPR
jgi:hypothetical protein